MQLRYPERLQRIQQGRGLLAVQLSQPRQAFVRQLGGRQRRRRTVGALGRQPQRLAHIGVKNLRWPDGPVKGDPQRLVRTWKRIFNDGREDVGARGKILVHTRSGQSRRGTHGRRSHSAHSPVDKQLGRSAQERFTLVHAVLRDSRSGDLRHSVLPLVGSCHGPVYAARYPD